jgi:hypothetical protein
MPESISIVYDDKDGRPTLAVMGAFGGPTPEGMVVAHVYTEYHTIPSLEEHEVGPGGVVDMEKGNRIRRGDITREIQATLVLSPESAIRLGGWLQQKAQIAIQARKENPPQ